MELYRKRSMLSILSAPSQDLREIESSSADWFSLCDCLVSGKLASRIGFPSEHMGSNR